MGGFLPDGSSLALCTLNDRPTIIDVSAEWCGPCHDIANCMAGQGSCPDIVFTYMRSLVEQGTIYWVTILAQDANGQKAGIAHVQAWDEAYPVENLRVITDENSAAENYLIKDHWPTIDVMSQSGTWFAVDSGSYVAPLVAMYECVYAGGECPS